MKIQKHIYVLFSLLVLGISMYAQPAIGVSNTILINFGYPELVIEGAPAFDDQNQNNTIDVGEFVMVSFTLKNTGKYVANNVMVLNRIADDIQGLYLAEPFQVGNIAPDGKVYPKFLIKSDSSLAAGIANLKFDIIENGDSVGQVTYSINTADVVQKARLNITSHAFYANNNRIRVDENFTLRIDLQNLGNATAKEVTFNILVPNQVLIDTDLEKQTLVELKPGEVKELRFRIMAGVNYRDPEIPIVIQVNESTGESSASQTIEARVYRN